MRVKILAALFCLVVTGASFVLLEFGVRMLVPNLKFHPFSASMIAKDRFGSSYGYRQNQRGIAGEAEFVIDESGFRQEPASNEALSRSVVVIGDSVASGYGVKVSETFVSLLARRERSRMINTSVIGYHAGDYLNVVRHFVIPNHERLKIERVLLFITLNDVKDGTSVAIRKHLDERRGPASSVAWAGDRFNRAFNFNTWLTVNSKLYVFLKSLILDHPEVFFRSDAAAFEMETDVATFERNLSEIKAELAAAKIPLKAFVLPYHVQMRRTDDSLDFPQRKVMEIAQRLGIDAKDLTPLMRKRMAEERLRARDIFLYDDHCHLAARGHEMVAKLIADLL